MECVTFCRTKTSHDVNDQILEKKNSNNKNSWGVIHLRLMDRKPKRINHIKNNHTVGSGQWAVGSGGTPYI